MVAAAFAVMAGGATARAQEEPSVFEAIAKYREETWRWQRLMGRPRTPYWGTIERTASEAYRERVLSVWKRARRARAAAYKPRRLRAWLCIHRHEGPWTAKTGNGYYGGLQMDMEFQRTYGAFLLWRKGPAHRWRRSSRSGSPSAPTGAAAGSTRGRIPPAPAG